MAFANDPPPLTSCCFFFFFNDTATTEIYTISLHDALPIFAGNVRRKPLGLAEVSLTLTRNGGEIPTDYEEVNVCRRLYSSGESEYLHNKVPCRLRDVQDLFIDTGLAGEPYALIE